MNNQFEIFVQIVEQGSYAKAAKALYKSASAISKHINMLEETLEVKLLERTTRSVVLTEAGQTYYEHCKKMCREMKNVESALKSAKGKPAGNLKLTCPSGIAKSSILATLGRFAKQYPEIKLDIVADNDVISLKDKQIDFAFRTSPSDSDDLIGIDLMNVEPVVCASPDIVSEYGYPSSIEDLAKYPYVLPTYMNLAQKTRTSFPALSKLSLDEHHSTNDVNMLVQMAKQGLGVAILFKHIVAEEIAKKELVNLFPSHNLPPLAIYLIHQKQKHLPAKKRAFIDFFKAEYIH